MSTTITRTTTFEVIDCTCGLLFAITNEYAARMRQYGKNFYCPAGHVLSYTESDLDRAKKRAERLERTLASREEDLRIERVSHSATKGQLTKARRRADRGVCQHCKRSFVNVQKHVETKHPDVLTASA